MLDISLQTCCSNLLAMLVHNDVILQSLTFAVGVAGHCLYDVNPPLSYLRLQTFAGS